MTSATIPVRARTRSTLVGLVGLLVVLLPAAPARATTALPQPAGWPLLNARVARAFDPPELPWGRGHRGVDLAAAPGDAVLAAAAGRVVFAGTVAGRGVLSLDHGGVVTSYEPVIPVVGRGQSVGVGEVVGTVGTGGHCGDRCLHWGLRVGGRYRDPLLLVGPAWGAVRLVPEAERDLVAREAAARAASARTALTAAGSLGFTRPVPGPVSSPFGMRLHPVLRVWKLHDGTDFAAACGTPIRAPARGVVRAVSTHPAYGHRLFLDHGRVGGHRVLTGYNHALRYVVRPGTAVGRGALLGYVGSTGTSTGCHLHLMLWRDGVLRDPMTVL